MNMQSLNYAMPSAPANLQILTAEEVDIEFSRISQEFAWLYGQGQGSTMYYLSIPKDWNVEGSAKSFAQHFGFELLSYVRMLAEATVSSC